MTLGLTIFGLILTLAGICCGVRAYLNTLAEHDSYRLKGRALGRDTTDE